MLSGWSSSFIGGPDGELGLRGSFFDYAVFRVTEAARLSLMAVAA